jgi:glycerol uptake facilitator-like aquaporin
MQVSEFQSHLRRTNGTLVSNPNMMLTLKFLFYEITVRFCFLFFVLQFVKEEENTENDSIQLHEA